MREFNRNYAGKTSMPFIEVTGKRLMPFLIRVIVIW
jgi:hypothetical protein